MQKRWVRGDEKVAEAEWVARAKELAAMIDERGLHEHGRHLITGPVCEIAGMDACRFTVWGPRMMFVQVRISKKSLEGGVASVYVFENSPRRRVPLSSLENQGGWEDICRVLWPPKEENAATIAA